MYFSLFYALSHELLQLTSITYGSFDFYDIVFILAFWVMAYKGTKSSFEIQDLLSTINKRTVICMSNYAIIYLAHVQY